MHSMTQENTVVVGGVDAHADAHHVAALDERGALLSTKSFPTTTPGYRELLDWLSGFGEIDAIAVESTGSYAAALVRYLREHDVRSSRSTSRTRTIVVVSARATDRRGDGRSPVPGRQSQGRPETDRRDRRVDPAAARSAKQRREVPQRRDRSAARHHHHRPARAPRSALCRKTLRGKATVCARFRRSARELRSPSQAAKFALRSIAQRIETLDREITTLDRELEQLVAIAAPRTTQLLGISTGHAGQLLVTAGQNIERLHGESSYAALCGASPIPASSGKTTRHRLNYGGDRQANRALHLIAVCRLRYCPRTRAYAKRRTAEGETKREIMRCLKRYIAREVYNSLRADLADTNRQSRPPVATTIICGNPGLGITHKRT